jgi:hypothetical protein
MHLADVRLSDVEVGDPERHIARPDHDRLNERLRQAFINGAEADSRRRLGRAAEAALDLMAAGDLVVAEVILLKMGDRLAEGCLRLVGP